MARLPPELTVAKPVPGLNSKLLGADNSNDFGFVPAAEKSSLAFSIIMMFSS